MVTHFDALRPRRVSGRVNQADFGLAELDGVAIFHRFGRFSKFPHNRGTAFGISDLFFLRVNRNVKFLQEHFDRVGVIIMRVRDHKPIQLKTILFNR